jgi:hypothetical protein
MGVFPALVVAAMVSGIVQAPPASPAPAVPGAPAVPVPSTRPLSEFAGAWKYNEELSVNATTGRSETARAVNDRRGVGAGPGAGISGGGGAGNRRSGSAGVGGRGGTTVGGPVDGAFSLFIASRDTRRDLLEIAPRLRVEVSEQAMTVTDDLDRPLVFPLDSSKQKYQLGAATFEARTSWDAGQLKTDIEGPDGLKMFQTWFLSEDGTKLFLIIRVGVPVPGARPVGVNRVYDREP